MKGFNERKGLLRQVVVICVYNVLLKYEFYSKEKTYVFSYKKRRKVSVTLVSIRCIGFVNI